MLFSLLLLVYSFFLAYTLYFPALRLSLKLGAVDYPNHRKTHSIPTARAGGFAFFAAFSMILSASPIEINLKISLLVGGTVMFCVGLLDDTRQLSPFQKLTGQTSAAAVFILLGESRGVVFDILSFAWIVFLCNAINLCDGLDGLAGGITATQALCLCLLSLIFNNINIFICSLLLLGTILGFLPRNFPHAKIFMGDCGALFLGFILGAISSHLVFDTGGIVCLIATFLVFHIPTYDTNLSIIRRLIKRKNPFKADRGHFHHRLVDAGFTKECSSLALITASLSFGLLGVIIAIL